MANLSWLSPIMCTTQFRIKISFFKQKQTKNNLVAVNGQMCWSINDFNNFTDTQMFIFLMTNAEVIIQTAKPAMPF